MFQNDYEKDIAKKIIEHYNHKKGLCEQNLHNGKRYEIGLKFTILLKKLSIKASIIFDNGVIRIITLPETSITELDDGENYRNLAPEISDELNNQNLEEVKLLQTVSFLQLLERYGYILIISDPHIRNEKKDEYDITVSTIFDVEIVQFVKHLIQSRIIPTTALINIAKNEFKTDEQIQYEKQLEISQKSLEEAHKANNIAKKNYRLAFTVAIVTPIVTAVITIITAFFIPTTISENSIYKIGREIKINSITSYPLIINNCISNSDTIKNGQIENEKP